MTEEKMKFTTSTAPIPFGVHINSIGGLTNANSDTITPELLARMSDIDLEVLAGSKHLNPTAKAIIKKAVALKKKSAKPVAKEEKEEPVIDMDAPLKEAVEEKPKLPVKSRPKKS